MEYQPTPLSISLTRSFANDVACLALYEFYNSQFCTLFPMELRVCKLVPVKGETISLFSFRAGAGLPCLFTFILLDPGPIIVYACQ